MYYPQSQIQCNLFSNGELIVKNSKKVYTGYYWSTSTGKFFTGKSPSKEPQVELLKLSGNPSNRNSEPSYDQASDTIYYSSYDTVKYLKLNTTIDPNNFPQTPTYIASKPTIQDYESGEFTRFFCKKINEPKFIETDRDTYTKLSEESPKLDYETYRPFKLNWVISGDQQKVARENKNAVVYAENKLGAVGLSQYLKFNYTLYYNFTPGITKRNLKRIYSDNGQVVPTSLPPSYRLEKSNKACLGCTYNQGGVCNKWSSPIRANYYCKAYKPLTLTKEQKNKTFLDSLSNPPNIYNQ